MIMFSPFDGSCRPAAPDFSLSNPVVFGLFFAAAQVTDLLIHAGQPSKERREVQKMYRRIASQIHMMFLVA